MFVQLGAVMVHAQVRGPASAPAVLLLHSMATDLHMWDPQAEAMAQRYRVVAMDMRGHGLTTAPAGEYSMTDLAEDGFALLDALGIAKAHVAGVSIGGRIALQMAALKPERVLSLMPCDTALDFQPGAVWADRIAQVRATGMAPQAEPTLGRWVLDKASPSAQALRQMILTTTVDGYCGCGAALRDCSADEVKGITVPTTILVGEKDPGTTPAKAREIQAVIPGSTLHVLPGAAHIPNFEQAALMTRLLLAHLDAVSVPADRREAGMAVRKRVLGEAHVARSEAALTPMDAPFRDFILDGAWGGVWTRPGLSHRDRSLLCLGMLAALGHHDEFKLHVRATRNTGVTPEEIAEVLLQVAVYGGVPAANTALKLAKDILKEDA